MTRNILIGKVRILADNMILYNASTGKPFDSIDEFIKFYNQCYYISTSHWVEEQIDTMIQREEPYRKLDEKAFLNIFAWKTGRVNQQKCEKEGYDENGLFRFTKSKRKDGAEWGINGDKAVAITRYGVIKDGEDEDIDENGERKTLIKFLKRAEKLSEEYSEWLVSKTDKERKEEKYNKILKELKTASLGGIGSVYLVTFLYFITKGEVPIYDIFAMMALDAIYPGELTISKNPDDGQTELSLDDDKVSSPLGSVIKPRDLPAKDQIGFSHIMDREWKRGTKVYLTYKAKLDRFVDDYNKVLRRKGKDEVRYATCRDIDRALWVYGHLFRDKE